MPRCRITALELVGRERGFRLGCPQELGEGGFPWVEDLE